LGEPAKHIRPLSEARAIENGANFLAEGFLFSVAAGLIIGETWRSSRSQSKQRSDVNDSIEELHIRVRELNERLRTWEVAASEERQRHQELTRIMDRVVEIGLQGGTWAELQNDTPLQPPRIQSDLPMSSTTPYVNVERTQTDRPDNTVSNPNDT